MTKRNVLGMCLIVLALLVSIWDMHDFYSEQEKMQKTIDVQKEMIYNRDKQIEEKNIRIEGLNQEVFDLRRELEDKQVSRGASRITTYKITHYSGDETGGTLTASGEVAQENHTIACNSLPFGTRVRINGNIFVVEDRGAMDSNIIDIFVGSYEEALERGAFYTEVEILD